MIPAPMRSQNQTGWARNAAHVRAFARRCLEVGSLALGLSGCSHAALDARKPSAVEAAPPAESRARTPTDWAWIDGKELPLRMRLPFVPEWRRRETRTSLRLDHAGERCSLVVRFWPTSRLVTTDQCVAELGLIEPEVAIARRTWMSQDLTAHEDSSDGTPVVSQAFTPGDDYQGHLLATVLAPDGGVLAGIVVAVAAGVGRCLAVTATTEAEGGNAEMLITDRLAWLVEGVAKSVTVRSVESRLETMR